MIVFRKRLVFWLIKAYIKKWGKFIFAFFLIGLLAFFLIIQSIKFFASKIPVGYKELIGIVGNYTLDQLPPIVLNDLSKGLTFQDVNGLIQPQIAKSWKIEDNGRKYTFYLKDNIIFNDNSKLTSSDINYNFSAVLVERPNKFTIIFKLKDSYSPFLTSVSRPILKKKFIGTGNYKLKDLELNGQFIKSVTLVANNDPYKIKTYQFYPSVEALKLAFAIGEIDKALGLSDLAFQKTSFEKFQNTKITKKANYKKIVTLFYNNKDSNLSDKKLRNALSYSLPDEFPFGERTYNAISKNSWAYSYQYIKYQDLEHANVLLSGLNSSTDSAKTTLNIKTLRKYVKTAKFISNSFEKLNFNTKIEIVDQVPNSFQIFLGDFQVPNDPDQYVLWHSSTEQNITKFNNMRIDKLLEDGRKTTNLDERKKIYTDFQKYLLDESPATFLYFPYEYELRRK